VRVLNAAYLLPEGVYYVLQVVTLCSLIVDTDVSGEMLLQSAGSRE